MTDEEPGPQEIAEKAIAHIGAQQGASLIGNWLVIAERYDENGAPSLMCLASADSTIWTRIGMLTIVLNNEKTEWNTEPDDSV